MPTRSLLTLFLAFLVVVSVAVGQRPRLQIPRGFGPPNSNGLALPENGIRIVVTNLDEAQTVLPDTELASDFLRDVDTDIWHGQDDDRQPKPRDIVQELIRLGAPDSVNRFGYRGLNGLIVFTLAPVEDYDDFIDSIDYGIVLSENSEDRTVKIEIDLAELERAKLTARAQSKGPDAVESLQNTLEGVRRAFGRSDDKPAPTNRLGADFSAGDYVEATIAGKPIRGRVLTSKSGSFDRPVFKIEVLDKKSLEGLTKDLKLRRRVKAADQLAFWMPPSRLRKLRGAPTPLQKERTWTDKSGGFSVQATYVSLRADRVVLKLSSGKEVVVPLAKLSDADRGHIEDLTKADANPFASGSTPNLSVRADWSRVKEIAPRRSSKWRWKPPEVARPKVLASPHARFDLNTQPGKGPSGTKMESLYVSDDGSAGIAVMDVGHTKSRIRLQRFDIATGEVDDLVACPVGSRVLDTDPSDGLVALATTSRGRDEDSRIFLQRLVDNTLEPICDFETRSPNSDATGLIAAKLLGDSRLVTWTDSGLVTWDYTTGTAIHAASLAGYSDSPLIVGPEQRFIFAGGRKAIAVVDTQAGKMVASIPHGLGSIESLAIDKRMKRLTLTVDDKIFTIDLATGEVINSLLGVKGRGDIDFIGKFQLYDGRYLIAPKYPVYLWQYVMADGASYDSHATIRGRRMWYATREGEGKQAKWSIASIALPHERLRERIKELGDLDEMILLTEGDSITVETDTDLDDATTKRLRETIAKAFQAAGFKIVATAEANTKKVVITCKKANKPIEVKVAKYVTESPADGRPAFKPPPGFAIPRMAMGIPGFGGSHWVDETHTVTPYHSSIAIRHEGKTLWSDVDLARDGQRFPNFRNDPVQTVLKRITEPHVERLLATELPAQICRKGPVGGTFGASLLSADGIVEDYLGDEE